MVATLNPKKDSRQGELLDFIVKFELVQYVSIVRTLRICESMLSYFSCKQSLILYIYDGS